MHKAIAVFVDLRKAFDSVQHNIFLSKLELYGIKRQILMWFSSYLQNRKQFVTIDGHSSDIHQVEYGVPQGGVLSTFLFLIIVNDLNKALKFTHAIYMQMIKNNSYWSDFRIYEYQKQRFRAWRFLILFSYYVISWYSQ